MGTCQSQDRDVTTLNPAKECAVISSKAAVTKSIDTVATVPSSSFSTQTSSPKSPTTSVEKKKALDGHESYSDHTEVTVDVSERNDGIHQAKSNSETQSRTSPNRMPLSKIRPGYSSGGSSDYSDESETNESGVHNHLIDWRNELASDNDLSKKVVHIETDFGRSIDDVYEGVHDGEVLGSGVAGIVRKVKHRKTGVNYAVKCLDLGLINGEKTLQALREEIFIMCQLDHPNIVRLEEVYESDNEIYLIQELCLGGDLFDRLDEQPDFHYSEAKCAKLVKQMLSSVRYLHSKKIVHRDLKLENFLFSSPNPDSELRMIDFGLSKHFTYSGELQHECVGTPYTVAPEVIRAEYDEKIDIWALGVITYLLLCGETPFGGCDGENLACVRNNILKGQVQFVPEELWEHVSDEGKAFVKRLLDPLACQRPTAKEAQLDPWLQTYGKRDAKKGDSALNPNIAKALVEFKEYSDMRKLLCEVLSFTLLPEQIVDLRAEFEKIDPDGDGEISLASLRQVLMQSAEAGALGGLTESEVKEIFNALRVRKSEKKIRWHEFIAAGLSQCDFDERNLKLAFDRFDYDRKGFITFQDMKDLLGSSDDGGERDVLRMWQDGMNEYACPLGRISYESFRMFIKGQKQDRDTASPRRRSHGRISIESSPILQAVPEGSMSPQAKHQTFSSFSELSALDTLKMPMLGLPVTPPLPATPQGERKMLKQVIDIPMPVEPTHKRTRSRSLGDSPNLLPHSFCDIDEDEELALSPAPRRNSGLIFPGLTITALHDVIKDESKTPLVVNRAIYRKHREFRISVLEASKEFDLKRHARKMQTQSILGKTGKRASLVMSRGSPLGILKDTESEKTTPTQIDSTKSEHVRKLKFEDASKRSGRPRRQRLKTTSDISGMLR